MFTLLLRFSSSPPTQVAPAQPPGCESSYIIKGFALRFLKISVILTCPARIPHRYTPATILIV